MSRENISIVYTKYIKILTIHNGRYNIDIVDMCFCKLRKVLYVMSKKKICISIDEETYTKLKEITEGLHTNISQWVTDRTWEYEYDRQQLRILKYNQVMANQAIQNQMLNYAYEEEKTYK